MERLALNSGVLDGLHVLIPAVLDQITTTGVVQEGQHERPIRECH